MICKVFLSTPVFSHALPTKHLYFSLINPPTTFISRHFPGFQPGFLPLFTTLGLDKKLIITILHEGRSRTYSFVFDGRICALYYYSWE